MGNGSGTSKDSDSEKAGIHTNDKNYKNSLKADETVSGTSGASTERSASLENGSATQNSHSSVLPTNSISEIFKMNEERRKFRQSPVYSKKTPSIITEDIPEENADAKENTSKKSVFDNEALQTPLQTDQTSEASKSPTTEESSNPGSHEILEIPSLKESEGTIEESTSPGFGAVPPSPAEESLSNILVDRNKRGVSPGISQDIQPLSSGTPLQDDREMGTQQNERRPSFMRRQILAMEKELELENIEKPLEYIFTPKISSSESIDTVVEKKPQRIYLTSTMVMIFIVSIMTGSSMTSVPYYLKMSNWFGVFLIILLALNAMYAGLCIGWSWLILEEMWPEYVEYSRIPYQDIAYRAFGVGMKYVVGIIVDVSILGTCAVFMIFIADSLENLTYDYVRFCHMLFVVTLILLPLIMFGSYRNIKLIGILDVILSIAITLFFILAFFLDKPSQPTSVFGTPSFDTVVISFGGFSYAYGYGPALCNILLDMSDRTMFTESLATAIIVGTVIYLVLAIMGFGAYGEKTPFNVLLMIMTNATYRPMGIFINCLYIVQVMTSFVVYILPTMLAFEVRVQCPDRFGIPRVLLRASILLCILLLVLGVPSLTRYVEIVGATSINLATFIIPPIAYVCLVNQQSTNSRRNISKKEWFLIVETVLLGICLIVVASLTRYDAARQDSENRISCYLNMTNKGSEKAKRWSTFRRPPGI